MAESVGCTADSVEHFDLELVVEELVDTIAGNSEYSGLELAAEGLAGCIADSLVYFDLELAVAVSVSRNAVDSSAYAQAKEEAELGSYSEENTSDFVGYY